MGSRRAVAFFSLLTIFGCASTSAFAAEMTSPTAVGTSPTVTKRSAPPTAQAGATSAKPAADADAPMSSAIRFKVEKYQLANGLTVLLSEDHSAPIISYQTWFRIGSKYETPGLTGMAHLFEHMMFKGAKRYSGDQFDHLLQSNGATNNAFTTQDYTGYYENLPSSKLELVMDLESDRMENLKIDADNLKSEREVVKEERRFRVDNNPSGLMHEALFTTAFKVHPYRWPVIGSMADLDNVTVEIAQKFHRTYYAPNNAVLVIAGDFRSAYAKTLIERYYGHIAKQEIPTLHASPEPEQKSNRITTLERDVQTTQFLMAYHTPASGSDDAFALDLLANIMGNGPSSRLYQHLVYKDQSVAGVQSYNMTLQDSGLYVNSLSLKPGAKFDSVRRTLLGEMWRPRNLLISNAELQKAKNQVMVSFVDGLKTVHGKAEALALNEILFHNYEVLFTDLDRYSKVTAEQIKKVAAHYLAADRITTIVLKLGHAKQKESHK